MDTLWRVSVYINIRKSTERRSAGPHSNVGPRFIVPSIYGHRRRLTRGVATGWWVYRYIYPPNQSILQIFMWLLVVFFSLTQDKFDMVPMCALARVSFTYLHTTIYTPHPNEIPGYAPAIYGPSSVKGYGKLATK